MISARMAPISATTLRDPVVLHRSRLLLCLLWLLLGGGTGRRMCTRPNAMATADTRTTTMDDNAVVVSKSIDVLLNATTTNPEQLIGKIRYYYYNDQNETNNRPNNTEGAPACTDIMVLGVGTAMSVDDYEALSQQMVETAAPGLVVIVSDPNPGRLVKTSAAKYVRLFETIRHRVGDWIPSCREEEDTTHPQPTEHNRKFYSAGHSASGQAALVAAQQTMYSSTTLTPDGFVGLDPYDISTKTMLANVPISMPTLAWGFSTTTCLVGVNKAAKGAYDYSSVSMGRVLYQVDNTNDESGAVVVDHGSTEMLEHCVFADDGCGVGGITVCPTERNHTNRHVLFEAIATSIRIFLTVLREQQQDPPPQVGSSSNTASPFSKQQFDPPVKIYTGANPEQNRIFLYVANDNATTEEEEEKIQASSPPPQQQQSSSAIHSQILLADLLISVFVSIAVLATV